MSLTGLSPVEQEIKARLSGRKVQRYIEAYRILTDEWEDYQQLVAKLPDNPNYYWKDDLHSYLTILKRLGFAERRETRAPNGQGKVGKASQWRRGFPVEEETIRGMLG